MEESEAPSLDCEKEEVIKEDSSSGSEGLSSWFGNILDVTQLASSAEAMSRSAQTLVGDWHNKVVEKAEAAGEEMRAEQARLRAENDRNKVCFTPLFLYIIIEANSHCTALHFIIRK